jgi:serine phosphatase RsbU (regulator of sigma subunit)
VLGGDFFDAVQSTETCLQVVLGDVCGHGPDEAALGVQLRIAWRSLVMAGLPPDAVLETLDRVTVQERHADHVFATLVSLRIDLGDGSATLALAGHPPPIVIAADGPRLLAHRPGGPPLGLAERSGWELDRVSLGDRWSLLLYSDGIYEGRAADRGGRLEIEGLLELLRSGSGAGDGLHDAPDRLIDAVEALNHGPLDDDVALLSLTRDADR